VGLSLTHRMRPHMCLARDIKTRTHAWLFLSVHILASFADAQTPSNGDTHPRQEPIAIYMDCKGVTCDHDFLRTDIAFVTHMRDRHDADVHVLITAQPTAEGGTEVTLNFIGQKQFDGVGDSLRYVSRPADTADEVRQGLSNAIKRGLVRYANVTPQSDDISVVYTPSTSASTAAATTLRPDPWNHWTFGTTVNGYVNGEESVQSMSVGVSLSANRTTDTWKLSTSIQSQYDSTTFNVDAGRKIEAVQRTHAFSTLLVGSVNEHMSVGARASALSSRFLNQKLTLRLAPAIEYNVFRYRHATNRMLTFEYSVGGIDVHYEEETIFGKTHERLLDQRLLASLRLTQKWGSMLLAAEGAQYLHDRRKERGTIFGSIEWNLAKGLSLVTSVDLKRIRDQLSLPARSVSQEEILLRERQLTTSYIYSGSLGISYTFGSPLAKVVNRRFAGSLGTVNVVH
jgi:hypothetical protein